MIYSDYPYYILTAPSESIVTESPFINDSFDLALEQGETDVADIRDGIKVVDTYFNPETSEKNLDGTYKRIVYNQIKNSFYGYQGCKDFTKLFGLDNIDLVLDGRNRILYDKMRVVSIPQICYGDRIVENSVLITDTTDEQSYSIVDDGVGNLITRDKIFSSVVKDEHAYLTSYHSSSVIDADSNGIYVDGILENDINWKYLESQYLFFKKEDIKNFIVFHDVLSETPPMSYESNLGYIGIYDGNSSFNLNNIPSSSYTISSSLLGVFNKIECGQDFVMVLDTRNSINCWGDGINNLYGEHYHIISEYSQGLLDISAGDVHAIFLDSNYSVHLWEGSNASISSSFRNNDIGSGKFKYISSGPSGSLLITTSGSVVGFGINNVFDSSIIPATNDAIKVCVGSNHAMMLTSDGSVFTWGDNSYNQIEIPSLINQNAIDIACGDNHNIALLRDGRIVLWGDNTHGQAFAPFGDVIDDWGVGISTDKNIIATVGLSHIERIQAKHDNTCVFKKNLCDARYTKNDYMLVWGLLNLISKYRVLQCGLGIDYIVAELDNPYQQIRYYPNFKYYPYPTLIYNSGSRVYTASINLFKEGEYNSNNVHIQSPNKYASSDDTQDIPIFSYEKISEVDSNLREYVSISQNMLIGKFNLTNNKDSNFYLKQVSSDFFVTENSMFKYSCDPINATNYFVKELLNSGIYSGSGGFVGVGGFTGTGSLTGTGTFTGYVGSFYITNQSIDGRYDGTGSFVGTGSFTGSGEFAGAGKFSPTLSTVYFIVEGSSDFYLFNETGIDTLYFADSITDNLLYLKLEPMIDSYEIEYTLSDNLNLIRNQHDDINVPVETLDSREYLAAYISDLTVPIYLLDEEKEKILITEFISNIVDYE